MGKGQSVWSCSPVEVAKVVGSSRSSRFEGIESRGQRVYLALGRNIGSYG